MRLIDADALYERASELESQALSYVGKIVNDETKVEEWKRWSAILVERTAFKHDVFDAPTIEERKTGQWLPDNTFYYETRFVCSECHNSERVPTIGFTKYTPIWDYCPNCGCKMEVEHE